MNKDTIIIICKCPSLYSHCYIATNELTGLYSIKITSIHEQSIIIKIIIKLPSASSQPSETEASNWQAPTRSFKTHSRDALHLRIQEPYVGAIKRMKAYQSVRVFQNTGQGEGTVKAAIAIFDTNLDVNSVQYPQLATNNIVVVDIRTSAWMITRCPSTSNRSNP